MPEQIQGKTLENDYIWQWHVFKPYYQFWEELLEQIGAGHQKDDLRNVTEKNVLQ